MKLLLPILLLAACVPPYDRLPRQDEAIAIVWHLTYGELQHDPPSMQWVVQKDLDCGPDSTGTFRAFYRWRWYGDVGHSDQCVGGVTWEDWGPFCQVALPDGSTFSTTAFSHELYHAYLHFRDGDGDAAHKDPGFGTSFGHPYGAADAAADALKAAGL